eukprot:1301248-Karenia_brevis.AAC.1
MAHKYAFLLDDFRAFGESRGFSSSSPLFPDSGKSSSGWSHANVHKQKGLHNNKHGIPCLIPKCASPEQHLKRATEVTHPFHAMADLGTDLEFAISHSSKMGARM